MYDAKYRIAKVKGLILYVKLQRTTLCKPDIFYTGSRGSNMSLINVLLFIGGPGAQ